MALRYGWSQALKENKTEEDEMQKNYGKKGSSWVK